jgi:hypothetical protein
MNLKRLQDRVERLENVRGINKPTVILTVHFIKPDGTEEPLTPEEETALKSHKEKLRREAKEGKNIPFILWTRKEAQKLIAQQAGQDTSSELTPNEAGGKK